MPAAWRSLLNVVVEPDVTAAARGRPLRTLTREGEPGRAHLLQISSLDPMFGFTVIDRKGHGERLC